ncbi:histidine phosphatase family protein [Salsuginibacillus kocurii]|uniref:histidine phosphatase family protein n=1 Tax=Salsuginibacillus kocurii TaxID=427078 RepID=UPI00035EB1B4|nr:histidine phosphatase family protein [Salsuginibacillus kocurii]
MGTAYHVDLFLVRHGVTAWNKEKKYLGHTDLGVMKHELETVKELKQHLQQLDFDSVYTSDLRRCRETLSYLDLRTPETVDERLREMNFGDWEGKTYEELQHIQQYRNWVDDWESGATPNGESGAEFKARIESFRDDLCHHLEGQDHEKQNILIMTHGGVIRYLASTFVAARTFWELGVKHGQGMRLSLTVEKGEWRCSSLSAVPFPENETSSRA